MKTAGRLVLAALPFFSPLAHAETPSSKTTEAPQAKAADASQTKPKDQLSAIQEKIESLKKALDDTKEAQADAADALKQSEKSISDSSRRLYELAQQQKQSQEKLQSLQQQQTTLQGTVNTQQQRLSSQFYQQYLHGQPGYVQLALQQQDPGQIARQLQYFAYIARARAALIDSLQGNLQTLGKLNDDTAQALDKVSSLKQEQEKEHQALQAQKAERNKLLSSLSAKLNSQRGEIDKLKRDEKRLTDLVDRLARQAAAEAEKQRKAKQKARKEAVQKKNTPEPSPDKSADQSENKSPTPVGRNDSLPTDALDGSSFAALRGKLSLPVRGDILNRFGSSRADTGLSWKGLFIRSPEGNEVKSVAAGRVVFADWLRGFGNLLIVDHGGGYMSLYGNNQALLKQVGEPVKGGEALASVGNSGGNDASGLYFELRYQGKPFDPLSWAAR